MSKITKFITYSILFIFILSAFLVLILTKFGIETKRFNSLITNQVKKYNENLNIDINKVRVYLSIGSLKNPKLRISTKNPVLIYNNKEIDLKAVDTKIDILSYFKDNFILEEFEIWTKENKIKDLIAFAALEKPSLIIYNIFISKGDASVYGLINFNKDGKINNYKLNGEIKAAKLNFNKKFNFENINFSFKNYGKKTLITNTKFSFNKITFLSDEIIIPSFKEKINVYGDIRSKKTNINFNNLKIYFNNELNFIKNNEIIFETKNKFSFTIQKGKIKNLKYFSEIFLEKLILGFENNKFKNYFVNYKDSISLENNIIKIDYKNKNFSIDGESDYSFYNSTDQILYKIKKIKNNYDFSTSINFDKKNLKIKPIQYSKKKK